MMLQALGQACTQQKHAAPVFCDVPIAAATSAYGMLVLNYVFFSTLCKCSSLVAR
jgi:hypothetical protein